MNFKQWQQVLDGTKTQTRRLVDPRGYHDRARVCDHWASIVEQEDIAAAAADSDTWPFLRVISAKGRTLWQVGKTYAVQPGRGKLAVGRIKLLAIRQEHLQAISPQDALAEGIDMGERVARGGYLGSVGGMVAVERYAALWDSIHTAPGTTWAADPMVWVLEFELVQGEE